MNEKERQQKQIKRQTLKYLARGGTVLPVDYTANKGWREKDNKRPKPYLPASF